MSNTTRPTAELFATATYSVVPVDTPKGFFATGGQVAGVSARSRAIPQAMREEKSDVPRGGIALSRALGGDVRIRKAWNLRAVSRGNVFEDGADSFSQGRYVCAWNRKSLEPGRTPQSRQHVAERRRSFA